jgi:hypothetical protein
VVGTADDKPEKIAVKVQSEAFENDINLEGINEVALMKYEV